MFVKCPVSLLNALYHSGFVNDVDYVSAAVLMVEDSFGDIQFFMTKPNYAKVLAKFGDNLHAVLKVVR